MKAVLLALLLVGLAGCSIFEDAATSMAYDIERGVRHLEQKDGAAYVITHHAKARAGADARRIKVQFDKVGALIVWYLNEGGTVLESGSTSYLSRFVDIPATILLDQSIDAPLNIEVRRQNGRAIVVRVY